MKSQIVIETATGKEKIAVYAPNKKGNKQFNVDGKFYTDADFDKTFTIINNYEEIKTKKISPNL